MIQNLHHLCDSFFFVCLCLSQPHPARSSNGLLWSHLHLLKVKLCKVNLQSVALSRAILDLVSGRNLAPHQTPATVAAQKPIITFLVLWSACWLLASHSKPYFDGASGCLTGDWNVFSQGANAWLGQRCQTLDVVHGVTSLRADSQNWVNCFWKLKHKK